MKTEGKKLLIRNRYWGISALLLLIYTGCSLNTIIEIDNINYITIPATIEAEYYSTESGIEIENTEDLGGGKNVGYIDVGDYLTYNINVPSSGEYRINLRLASPTNGSKLDIYRGTEKLASVAQKATGDWQTWDTTSVAVYLNSGDQTIKLVATDSDWNINWLEFIKADIIDPDAINLNLRVHIMQDSPWIHPSGVEMTSWVTPTNVIQVIMPELNLIYSSSNIVWNVESIIEEGVNEFYGYKDSVDFVINTERDSLGRSDPDRLPHLYNLMQPENKSITSELETNLFHIYLFPFIGNTSQGNAMSNFGYHSVVGTWSNKHNEGADPEKTLLIENHDAWSRGSLSRTIAHELGHVLGLNHNQCTDCLMYPVGYPLTNEQIEIVEGKANDRL